MRSSIIKILNSLFFIFIATNFSIAASDKIAAIVNEKAITSYDVAEMKKMIMILNNISHPDPETDKKLHLKARESLINQVLIEQKAKELGVKIDKQDLIEHIEELESQNNLPKDFFKSLMISNNMNYQYFKDRMRFDMLIRRLQQTLFPREYINMEDINQIAIDSNAKPAKFWLKVFTSNGCTQNDYKQMLKFSKSLKECQHDYKVDYKKFATLKELKEDIKELSPLLRATARSLKANENSGVLKTENDFQILMVCHREVENISEKETNMIAHSIAEHKMGMQMQRFFSNLKKSAYIKIIAE